MDVGWFPVGSLGADRSSRNARQENTNSDQREQPTGVGCADFARTCLYAQKERGSAIAEASCGVVNLRNGRYWDRTSDNLLVRETVKLKAEIDKTFKSLARPQSKTGF